MDLKVMSEVCDVYVLDETKNYVSMPCLHDVLAIYFKEVDRALNRKKSQWLTINSLSNAINRSVINFNRAHKNSYHNIYFQMMTTVPLQTVM